MVEWHIRQMLIVRPSISMVYRLSLLRERCSSRGMRWCLVRDTNLPQMAQLPSSTSGSAVSRETGGYLSCQISLRLAPISSSITCRSSGGRYSVMNLVDDELEHHTLHSNGSPNEGVLQESGTLLLSETKGLLEDFPLQSHSWRVNVTAPSQQNRESFKVSNSLRSVLRPL